MKWPLILFDVGLTIGTYVLSCVLDKRYASPFTTPLFFSTTLVIVVLLSLGLRFDDYEPAKNIIVSFLGPATVALAVPLYKNRRTLLRHALPVVVGLAVGSLSTLTAAVILAKVFALSESILTSISVKSVTTPIAIEIATIIHGDQTLTAMFVIVTGMIGACLVRGS